jgi:hypothetical protein
MSQQVNNVSISEKKQDELDEFTFIEWKNELERNLPNFWDTMNQY